MVLMPHCLGCFDGSVRRCVKLSTIIIFFNINYFPLQSSD